MPDLVRGAVPRRIVFAVSLPHCLLATASLFCAAPRFEGLGDWLREARILLPSNLLTELCLLVTFPGRFQRFTGELASLLPVEEEWRSIEQVFDRLEALSGDQYRQLAANALAKGTTPPSTTQEIWQTLQDSAHWAGFLSRIESDWEPESVAALIRDGENLKQRVLQTLRRFWHECYADEYQATLPLMERSVAYQSARTHSPRLEDRFFGITGRLMPEVITRLVDTVEAVVFVPSCYVGPYVAYTHHDDRLIIYYNCRSTPSSVADSSTEARTVLYPPLKALADETRLEILALLRGQELYAQEIVDRLGLSQPAVSRHLNLMSTAGVLNIRRDGNAKYYSINSDVLMSLSDALRSLL